MWNNFVTFFESVPALIFSAGALGAISADIIKDNKIELPKIIDNNLQMGFIGGMIAGGIAGYIIDGSPLTAFMGGYVGKEIIGKILSKKVEQITEKINENTPQNQ